MESEGPQHGRTGLVLADMGCGGEWVGTSGDRCGGLVRVGGAHHQRQGERGRRRRRRWRRRRRRRRWRLCCACGVHVELGGKLGLLEGRRWASDAGIPVALGRGLVAPQSP